EAGTEEARVHLEQIEIVRLPLARVDRGEKVLDVRQPVPAGRAPAARLLREEMLQVMHHRDRARPVVENDHRPCAEPAAELLERIEIHRRVEMLLEEEI